MASTELRFGVVGTAHWAANVHAPGVARAKGARLAGVWGRDPLKAAAIADACGTRPYSSFDALLADVDALTFAVPPSVQAELAPRAIEAGKHVLLEKPISADTRSAERIAASILSRGLGSLVFFTRRFVPEIAAALERAKSRRWRRATVEVLAGALTVGSPYQNSIWRQEEGAALWDIGPHVLSLLVPVLGPVVAQSALAAESGFSRFETTHRDGAVATCAVTLRASPIDRCNRFVFEDGDSRLALPEPSIDYPAVFARAVDELCAAIRSTGGRHPLDVEFGLETVRVIDAIARDRKRGA